MGYDTAFNLSVECDRELEIIGELRNKSEQAKYCLDEDGNCAELGRWNFEPDLRQLSLEYPNILFSLHGDGDDVEDLWWAYFKNGKMQMCLCDYPPYDESKLE